mmetsp:Transcript_69493/g.62338  ORF Transcript_69493/g.62338 Transcript_69493/m.62338 type:complete len:375 (+) Transcript_69493:101-1225(+)
MNPTTLYNENNNDNGTVSYPYSPSLNSTVSNSPSHSPSIHSRQSTQESTQQNLYDPRFSLMIKGYEATDKITKTLQGSIWKGCFKKRQFTTTTSRDIVIKCTSRALHASKSTILNGEEINIEEDVVKEMEILRNLTVNGLTKYIVSYIDFFYDDFNYFLIMENGGASNMFDFVVKSHSFILNGSLSIIEWQNVCKTLFFQMVSCLDILHNKMNICHLDISLENMLLKNGEYFYETGKFTYSQQIKFCDFGLAEYFDLSANPSFSCNKHVGKESYMAPEVYLKSESFDARKADSWSLGVILFVLMSGAPAYSKPDLKDDKSFQYIVYKQIPLLLQNWGRLHYCNDQILDLLNKIFVMDPKKRISVEQIRAHPFLL